MRLTNLRIKSQIKFSSLINEVIAYPCFDVETQDSGKSMGSNIRTCGLFVHLELKSHKIFKNF